MGNAIEIILILVSFIVGLTALMIYLINAPTSHGLVIIAVLIVAVLFTRSGRG